VGTLNRFIPDTWWEALLRPLAMAAPNGGVYVEIMAQDIRFLAALLLAGLVLVLRKRLEITARSALLLAGLTALAFVPWLVTSGNGRYFVPFLLLVGPVVAGLAWALPATKIARLATALIVLFAQVAATADNIVLGAWGLTTWREDPYFEVAVPPDLREEPATFVSITSISYSLIAPQFNPLSHWVNIAAMSADPASPETTRAHALFGKSRRLYVIVPTVLRHTANDGQPLEKLKDAIDAQISSQRLAIDRAQACRVLHSRGMSRQVLGDHYLRRPVESAHTGFWLCALRYPVAPPPTRPLLHQWDAAFEQLERRCPGIFPPGTAGTSALADGLLRDYAAADMKAYVMDNGVVYYRYWRSLNLQRVGTLQDVMNGTFSLDCTHIQGRSGMPWDRSI
jgi:hypothetical protein